MPSKLTETIQHGDVFRHELAGAGGWGDPLERDPQAVLRDLRNELIGVDTARDDYGVIVDRTLLAGRIMPQPRRAGRNCGPHEGGPRRRQSRAARCRL